MKLLACGANAAWLPRVELAGSGVHTWLGHELEVRGIDAVVYTRYILSLLRAEADIESIQSSACSKQRTKQKKTHNSDVDLRKLAAIECLLSVSESEEDCGIENLVDELCVKLHEQEFSSAVTRKVHFLQTSDIGDSSGTESDDPAERYYAAFPALSKEAENVSSSHAPAPVQGSWAKLAASQRKEQADSEQVDKVTECLPARTHLEEEVKQPCNRTLSRTPGHSLNTATHKWSTRIMGYGHDQTEHKQRGGGGTLPRAKDDFEYNKSVKPKRESTIKKSKQKSKHSSNSPHTPEWFDYEHSPDDPSFIVPKVVCGNVHIGYPEDADFISWFPTTQQPRPHYKSVMRGKEWLDRLVELLQRQGHVPPGTEDLAWYTQPIEDLLPTGVSVEASQRRLYHRHTVTPEPGAHTPQTEPLTHYLQQLKEQLEEELARCEDRDSIAPCDRPSPPPSEPLNGIDIDDWGMPLDGVPCQCSHATPDNDDNMDMNFHELWKLKSPNRSNNSTPASTENEVLDHRPVSVPFLEINNLLGLNVNTSSIESSVLSVDTALAWLDQDNRAGSHSYHWGENMWLPFLNCTECADLKPALWLSCKGCGRSGPWRKDSPARLWSGAGDGLWASYIDLLAGQVHSPLLGPRSDLRHLHGPGYDGDPQWSPISDGFILPWIGGGDQASQLCGVNMSQIWDVNIHRHSWLETPGPPLDTIHSYLLNISVDADMNSQVFIKGGLYGSVLCPEDSIWEHQESPCQMFEESNTDTSCWQCPAKPALLLQKSQSMNDLKQPEDVEKSSSVNIKPSENTAFTDAIPSRLHHVQSEPSLTSLLNAAESVKSTSGNACRLVQVRYLYKSDSSILPQLGLASEANTPTHEKIELSPHMHFRPIDNPGENRISVDEALHPSEFNKDKDEEADTLDYLITGTSHYQLYLGEETQDMARPCFVPKFRVDKNHEKSAQTGENSDFDKLLPMDAGEANASMDECLELLFSSDMHDELELSREDAERLASTDMDSYGYFYDDLHGAGGDCNAADISLEEMSGMQLSQFWQSEDQSPHSLLHPNTALQNKETPCTCSCISGHHNQVWKAEHIESCQMRRNSIQLLDTANNNTLLNDETTPVASRCGDYIHSPVCYESDTEHIWSSATDDPLPAMPGFAADDAGLVWTEEDILLQDACSAQWNMTDYSPAPEQITLDPDTLWDESEERIASMFSSELEELWLKDNEDFEITVPLKNPSASGKKPCSFFMEGGCRRSDCRFAHDVSVITCRFWERGSCFKGLTCPFLHGYSNLETESPPLRNVPKIKSWKDFTLTDEDFPILASSMDFADEK